MASSILRVALALQGTSAADGICQLTVMNTLFIQVFMLASINCAASNIIYYEISYYVILINYFDTVDLLS